MQNSRDLMTATLAFGRMLRGAGLQVTVSELMDAVRALEVVDLMDRSDVYLGLRAVLVTRREELPAFDRCFDAFWRFRAAEGQGLEGLMGPTETTGQQADEDSASGSGETGGGKGAARARGGGEGGGPEGGEPMEVPGTSPQEVLMERDFSSFPSDQLDEVARVTVLIARRLAGRRSRRPRPVRRGGVVDLRRSVRANMMKGEFVELRRRERRRRKVRLPPPSAAGGGAGPP